MISSWSFSKEMTYSWKDDLYTCDDCGRIACLWEMHQRSHGGYDCRLCSGEVFRKDTIPGCLNVSEKEKLEK